MPRTPPDPIAAIQALCRHGVEFVVVGNVSGVLHGAPITTFDLDIVHERSPANIERLLAALKELEAGYRDLTGRHLAPKPDLLALAGHNLFRTRAGDLDALGTVGDGLSYRDLIHRSVSFRVGEFEVHTIPLDLLIELKEQAGRPKDLAALPVLRSTLRILRERGGSGG